MWVDLGKIIVATGFGMVAQSAKNRPIWSHCLSYPDRLLENTHHWEKYHCVTDLLYYLFGFNQRS